MVSLGTNVAVWCRQNSDTAVFRCVAEYNGKAKPVEAAIFADSYYGLYVNGTCVAVGPARFDPKAPEYDTVDLASTLRPGKNVIAVLVYGNVSNGTHMTNAPAFLFSAPSLGITSLDFAAHGETEYGKPSQHWGHLCDRVDARVGGGVLSAEFDDSAWLPAMPIPWETGAGCIRGTLRPRSLAMLSRSPVEAVHPALPYTGEQFVLQTQRNVIVYVTVSFRAKEGVCVEIEDNSYISDGKLRTYRTSNPVTTNDRKVHIRADGEFTLYDVKLETETYPWEIAGEFQCDDPTLTTFWQQCAYTLLQTSADGYISDGEERCEWTADSMMVEYPMSSVSVVSKDGIYSDPALLRKTVLDIAMSQGEDGMLKAHHPSDRFDIHAVIDDYCCNWVEALLTYYESSRDIDFVAEMKPILLRQLDAFCRMIGEDGLACAREFMMFDNPLKYRVCRGTTINCYIYSALLQGAKLLALCEDEKSAYYASRAASLREAINSTLYDAKRHTYYAAAEDHETVSYHAPMIALYCGVPEEETRKALLSYIHDHGEEIGRSLGPYTERFLFLALYEHDTEADDRMVLQLIKTMFAVNFAETNPGFVTYEYITAKSRTFHCFGMVPGYFLSAYVLGVRPHGAGHKPEIQIEPHLGALRSASGAVVTDFGVTRVSWEMEDDGCAFTLAVPEGVTALLRLPGAGRKVEALTINGVQTPFVCKGNRVETVLPAGDYSGVCKYLR